MTRRAFRYCPAKKYEPKRSHYRFFVVGRIVVSFLLNCSTTSYPSLWLLCFATTRAHLQLETNAASPPINCASVTDDGPPVI